MKTVAAVGLVCALLVGAVSAQEDGPVTSRLAEMFLLAPVALSELIDGGGEASYFDFDAARAVYPDVDPFDLEGPIFALASASTIAGDLYQAETVDMRGAIGIGLDDIAQAMYFGRPPAILKVLKGEFDAEAVRAALQAYGLAEAEGEGGQFVFCNPESCAEGMAQNIQARNPGNPFGGNIGRLETVILIESDEPRADLLIASPGEDLARMTAARAQMSELEPVDLSLMQAAGLFTSYDPQAELVMAGVFNAGLTLGLDDAPADTIVPEFVGFAGIATKAGMQHTLAGFIFDQDANVGGLPALLDSRLALQAVNGQRTYGEIFADAGLIVGTWTLVLLDDAQGLLLPMMVQAEVLLNDGPRLIYRMIAQRDFGWLLPVLD
ncbi:MAG: hypothetical protein KME04_18430 [Pleurocapsa minor GSE-CHR-MK-17-07R]|jgi:hypothetical protein|nr:hypothetical protein [Pleurocapsa minor GSE-CHR-MK 17-07R]